MKVRLGQSLVPLVGGAILTMLIGQSAQAACLTEPLTFQNSKYCLTSIDRWSGAQEKARDAGGNLVTINSSEEQSWLAENFGNSLFWIGLNDIANEGNYEWVSGQPVTYTNWAPGEPSNLPFWNPEGEDYVAMNWGSPGQWADFAYNLQNPFVWLFPGIVEIASKSQGPVSPNPSPPNPSSPVTTVPESTPAWWVLASIMGGAYFFRKQRSDGAPHRP